MCTCTKFYKCTYKLLQAHYFSILSLRAQIFKYKRHTPTTPYAFLCTKHTQTTNKKHKSNSLWTICIHNIPRKCGDFIVRKNIQGNKTFCCIPNSEKESKAPYALHSHITTLEWKSHILRVWSIRRNWLGLNSVMGNLAVNKRLFPLFPKNVKVESQLNVHDDQEEAEMEENVYRLQCYL